MDTKLVTLTCGEFEAIHAGLLAALEILDAAKAKENPFDEPMNIARLTDGQIAQVMEAIDAR